MDWWVLMLACSRQVFWRLLAEGKLAAMDQPAIPLQMNAPA
jgi:hypothetical protein